ncbi:MAG: restriction endonuclease subunit S [Oscillospiraceae bacterium]|nr:restriction endonuclease subunit S [Oscillospiraceae bacterium]
MIKTELIKSIIKHIGFVAENGTDGIYIKKYINHNNYYIKVNFNTKKIEYRPTDMIETEGIQWGDSTTCNFDKSENFVVLECVNRLLDKGYPPKSITLEKKYPLGRTQKGKLDIIVTDSADNAYLMIECKTWGTEFAKEHNKMLKDGGQLFSYYANDRAAKYLCLYTSNYTDDVIDYKCEIVPVDEAWIELSNTKEIHDHWNKNFKDNGIFEDWITAYNVDIKALVRGRLQPITKDDSGKIFNQFAEILRHNVVSDKPNAFNKILNLFICKIIDEDRNDDEQVEFQWLEDDTDQSLQLRLNDLYKKGMHKFLDIDVTDYTEKDIDDNLINLADDDAKKALMQMFVKLRLQKNPEFAFIEVYDDASFKLNARVVREVVELLQPYRFRYGHKQQFLGDFFEKLLNTSMKQEAGQFFTPTPIAHYIISCLPIKEFISNRLKSGNSDGILPAAIDFACGTGHFLTEYMDTVQNIIEGIDTKTARPTDRRKLNYWCGEDGKYEWAGEYVYGIDADYRLIKSSKVSSFLNGDGEANIIRANGLDHFKKSKEYRNRLTVVTSEDSKDNAQFDILIANPPYSVNAFKSTIQYGEESFELFNRLTDNSSEIECLFIERMKQLLKVGGYAGIILPSSILSNTGIYTAAREILLKYFYIVGITEFGSNTFMATGTNTVTLFLRRRDNADWKKIESAVNSFFDKPKDVTVLGIEKAFSKYVSAVYAGITIDDYVSFVNHKPTNNFISSEIYTNYVKWFDSLTEIVNLKSKASFIALEKSEQDLQLERMFYEKVFAIEKDKLIYFILTYSQRTVIIRTGEKQAEKEFLGYEFSNRRGSEGIKELPCGTKLFDKIFTLNPEKANFYIYNAFNNNYPDISESMQNNIVTVDTCTLIDFASTTFEKNIVTSNRKINYTILWNFDKLITLSEIAIIEKGDSITKAETTEGSIPVVAGGKDVAYYHNISNRDGNIITVSASGANSGFVNYWENPIFASDCNTIKTSNSKVVLTKYIYECLKTIQNSIYALQKGQAQPHVYASDLEQIKIPILPLETQKIILSEIEKDEIAQNTKIKKIISLRSSVNGIIDDCFARKYKMEKLGDIAQILNGGTPNTSKKENWNGNIYWATLVDTKNKYVYSTERCISEQGLSSSNACLLPVNTVLFSSRATIGDVSIAKVEMSTNQGYKNFICNSEKLHYEYLYYILKHESKNIAALASGMTYPEISKSMISEYKIPVPDLKTQNNIIEQIIAIEQQIDQLSLEVFDVKKHQQSVLNNHLFN